MFYLKTFLKSTLFAISLTTCLIPINIHAATWKQVTENIQQNSQNINTCLTSTLEEYNNKQPETPADGLAMIDQKIEKTHHCLNSMFQDYLNDTQIKLNFKNTTFTDQVSINGEFTVTLSSLKENSLITKNEITSFKLNNNSCGTANLEVFSYQIPGKAKRNFELQYALNIIAKLVDNDPNNQEIISLQNSLESLTQKNESIIMAEQLMRQAEYSRITNQNQVLSLVGQPPIPLPSLEVSKTYIESLDDSSPQLQIECESETRKLSVNNGISEITFINKRESQSSGGSFSSSSNTQKITIDGQTLTIRSNGAETTYQDLPLVVNGKMNPIILPGNYVESTPSENMQDPCLDENNPDCLGNWK